MHTAAQLIIGKFKALLSPVLFVYRFPTTVEIRGCHVEHFVLNG